jgi:hypothetical protein
MLSVFIFSSYLLHSIGEIKTQTQISSKIKEIIAARHLEVFSSITPLPSVFAQFRNNILTKSFRDFLPKI